MNLGSILFLAVGLAMDATAVAAARGVAAPRVRARDVALVAGAFGGFQALMPLLGWLIGSRLGPHIVAWDHWLAFGLLLAIGAKMLWEAWSDEPAAVRETEHFGIKMTLILAVATSVDAFAVGITLPLLGAPFALSLAAIGLITALLSGIGVVVGRRFGAWFGRRLEVVGGLVLIGLGMKILAEHLTSG